MMYSNNEITIEKLEIYQYYKGSIGNFEHAKKQHMKILSGHEFGLIAGLIQDIKLKHKGLVAEAYVSELDKKIIEMCDSPKTISCLYEIAIK